MSGAVSTFNTSFGTFDLLRYPPRPREPLRAWCAADELLLEEVQRLGVPSNQVLVVNDEQGALCTALQPSALWTDSAMAALALEANLHRNQRREVQIVWSTEPPPDYAALVVLRVPKQLPYFEYQLAHLAAALPAGATVLAAGMDKHLSPRTASLLEHYIGPTERQPGRRKARLFSAVLPDSPRPPPPPDRRYYCDELEAELIALPNVFSREGLDIGSRFLLKHLDRLAPTGTVLDLACGNGVLGLAALQRGLAAQLVCCDESAMAIASTRANLQRLFPERSADILLHQGDGLLAYRGPAPQLILCNPPFHINHAVDEFAGRRLLAQCAGVLAPGGKLLLVANRHLDYGPTLRRTFGSVEQLARNSKFILWHASLAQGSIPA